METLKNWEVDKENERVMVKVNPSIFPLEVIYSAAYMLIDKAYVIIDGDPEKEIFIEFTKKEDCELENLALEFNNELVNYAVYVTQAARNQSLREAIIQRALKTNSQTFEKWSEGVKEKTDTGEIEEEDYIEDPKGIAKPWRPEDAEGLELDEKEESNDEEESEISESEKEKIERRLRNLGY